MPVIYATGYSQFEPRPVSGSLFLQKPYRPEQLARPASEFQPTQSPILYCSAIGFSSWFRLRESFGLAFAITAKTDLIEGLAILGGLH